LGLSGQVLGVPPILMHKRRQGGDALAPGQKSAVLRAEEQLRMVPGAPGPENLVIMLRLGRGAAPTARAGRRPAPVFLVDPNEQQS
ncbi:MAG: hypothetical protein JRH20_19575, partial [Deltaproteobacteria bacterium]|nr:hypothetical protein [Deltaproteobacteria bacterium]